MVNPDLEGVILKHASVPISKSDLWRKTTSQKQDVFNAIDHLVATGNLQLTKEGRKHLVVTVDTSADDITWNGILKFQKDQLHETVLRLQEHEKLFKYTHTKMYHEGRLVHQYRPLNKQITSDLLQFSMQIDYLMQHLIKFQYALSFKLITKQKSSSRIERIREIITKEINKIMSDHPNEREGLSQFVQSQTRTWNINV
tara:strand:+ start:48 stop:644 length:597 start_codon:yes stop_codon:yes gene_type:complete